MGIELLLGILAGFGITGLFTLYFCGFRVEEGHVAVMTSFGKVEHEQDGKTLRIWGSGLHSKMPWQKVHRVSMMERLLDLSGREGGRQVLTEDGIILRLDSKLRYHVNRSELYIYLFQLKDPAEHIKGLFTCLLRNEIANFRGGIEGSMVSYDRIRRDLKSLNSQIESFCQSEISGKYGVKFNAVDVTDILPPDELAEALNAVINAQTDMQTRYARAEAECNQRILASERGVEIAKASASAVEIEIRTIAKHLKELHENGTLGEYVERRRAEVHLGARSVYYRRNA